MFEGMQHRVAGGAPQAAMRTGLQHMVQMLDLCKVVAGAMSGGYLVHDLFQHRGADATRRAETATLMREKMHEIARHFEQVTAGVEHHERAGCGDILEAQLAPEFALRDAQTGRAADLDSLRIRRAAIL